jgi:ABC-2 type transporter
VSNLKQLKLLSLRQFYFITHNPILLIAAFFIGIGEIGFQAALFANRFGDVIDPNDYRSDTRILGNWAGIVYYLGISISVMIEYVMVLNMPLQRPVHDREYGGGLYNLSTYYFSTWFVTTMLMMMAPCFAAISLFFIYDPANASFSNMLEYLSIIATLHIFGSCLGNFIGATITNEELATLIGIFVNSLHLISNGIARNLNDINWFYTAVSYINALRYFNEQAFHVLLDENPSKDYALDYYDFHTEIELNFLMPYALGIFWLFFGFFMLWLSGRNI